MTRIWQNLIRMQCPDCDSIFCTHPKGFVCPNPNCNFFITRKKYGEILMDQDHTATKYATPEQKSQALDSIRGLGLM